MRNNCHYAAHLAFCFLLRALLCFEFCLGLCLRGPLSVPLLILRGRFLLFLFSFTPFLFLGSLVRSPLGSRTNTDFNTLKCLAFGNGLVAARRRWRSNARDISCCVQERSTDAVVHRFKGPDNSLVVRRLRLGNSRLNGVLTFRGGNNIV